MAQFVSDEFQGTTLGTQWTWSPGTSTDSSATPSSYQLTGTHLRMEVAKSSAQSWTVDNAAYISQPQPNAENWEVVTKIDNFVPTEAGYQNPGNRVGLLLRQDNNHWLGVTLHTPNNTMVLYGQSQMDPNGDLGNVIKYKQELTTFEIGNITSTVYFKLRKSQYGYTAFFSIDNENWTQVLPLTRNPHSTDGSVGGDIVIYQSSASSTGNVRPADIDWARQTVSSDVTHAYADDEFNDGTIAPRWEFFPGYHGGVTSSTYNMTPGSVVESDGYLNMISGPGTDLSRRDDIANGERGPAITQPAPAGETFSVYTQVDPVIMTDFIRYRGQGIRIWQNQNNWLMIMTTKNGTEPNTPGSRNMVEVQYKGDDNTTRTGLNAFVGATIENAAPGFLRIDRNGNNFRAQYSFDEVTWTPVLTEQYPDGWIPMVLQPDAPLNLQLVAKRPRYATDAGNYLETSQFNFIRTLSDSSVSDWQLF
jgi:hypothetical protein